MANLGIWNLEVRARAGIGLRQRPFLRFYGDAGTMRAHGRWIRQADARRNVLVSTRMRAGSGSGMFSDADDVRRYRISYRTGQT